MNALALRNVGAVEIAIDPKAIAARDEAIENAHLVVTIRTHNQAVAGADALRGLRAITKAVESSRTTAKAPVLELGRRIDAAAKEFNASAEAEIARITAMLTAHETEQRRIDAEAQRQRQEEARRMVAEQAAATERAAAAERQANLPVVTERPKVSGTVVREEWTFEVTDLKAFAQAHPDLVEITVKRAAVLQKIRGGVRQLAHARIYEETKVGVRV